MALTKSSLSIISIACSAIATVFYLVGICGYAYDDSVVDSIPWGTGTVKSLGVEYDLYVGTSTIVLDGNSITSKQRYDNCDDDVDFCDECEDTGKAAFGLTIIAIVLSGVVLVISVLQLAGHDVAALKYPDIGASVMSAILGIIAFAIFDECIKKVEDAYDSVGSTSLSYAVGAYLVLVGFICMVFASISKILPFFIAIK